MNFKQTAQHREMWEAFEASQAAIAELQAKVAALEAKKTRRTPGKTTEAVNDAE